MPKLIIADDHPVYIQGLAMVLQQQPGFDLLGQASDGAAALALIRRYDPDIAILDVQMPPPDGFALAQLAAREQLRVKIIMLTMFREPSFISRVLELGVKGYVLKDDAVEDIVESVDVVHKGGVYFSRGIAGVASTPPEALFPDIAVLTKTERVILELIGYGKTSKVIAQELSVSVKTIENHRGNICKKLGITGTAALIKYALRQTRS